MSIQTMAMIWSMAGLAVAVALFVVAGRLGRARSASWLIVLGLVMIAVEEPLLTAFWATSQSSADRDGMADLITAPASAHVIDAAVLAAAFLVLLGWVALTRLRRGEPAAWWILVAGWLVVAATVATTAVTVYSRGVPLPTAGGRAEGAGYGWEQLMVGLLAWGAGLWLTRPARTSTEDSHELVEAQ